MKQCRSCGGVYADPQPDGSRYFHACGPLVDAFDEDGVLLTSKAAAALREDGEPVTLVERPRADHRDENIDPAKAAAALDAGGVRKAGTVDEALVKATGAGTSTL